MSVHAVLRTAPQLCVDVSEFLAQQLHVALTQADAVEQQPVDALRPRSTERTQSLLGVDALHCL
jgi:hypothetical protein